MNDKYTSMGQKVCSSVLTWHVERYLVCTLEIQGPRNISGPWNISEPGPNLLCAIEMIVRVQPHISATTCTFPDGVHLSMVHEATDACCCCTTGDDDRAREGDTEGDVLFDTGSITSLIWDHLSPRALAKWSSTDPVMLTSLGDEDCLRVGEGAAGGLVAVGGGLE